MKNVYNDAQMCSPLSMLPDQNTFGGIIELLEKQLRLLVRCSRKAFQFFSSARVS
jgi:hypothetical protein